MTPEQEERIVVAIESAAEAFDFMAGTLEAIEHRMAAEFAKKYPPKRQPAEATVTHVKTDEENLRENQGATGEKDLRKWATLDDDETTGPRETAWLNEQRNRDKEKA